MPSTQKFLPIKEIKDGIVVLNNNGLRVILAVSSLNFSLKSDEEQKAILYQFQNFLNSLDFACQICLQSRKLNIIGYLDKVKELGKEETNDLLKIQIEEYANFIQKIMAGGDIMEKNFFVVVPFNPLATKSKTTEQIKEERFQRNKSQLLQRAEFVILGLKGCGLQSLPLKTIEIAELFWSLHNLKEADSGYFPELPPELIS